MPTYVCPLLAILAMLTGSMGAKLHQHQPNVACHHRHGMMVPMPGNCAGFYVCLEGNAIANSCGPFYHFNARTGMCDHPLKAACKAIGPTPLVGYNATPWHELEYIPKPKSPEEAMADLSAGQICLHQRDGVMLPKQQACGQYYVCIQQRPYLRTCDGQLHFNAQRQLCQAPEQAQCEVPQPTDAGPPADETTVAYISCRQEVDGVLVPHLTDCERFFQCKNKHSMVMRCPKGLHFSPILQRCEWPSIAGCRATNI